MNRLIQETSPYLLQHAHNPVNWYSWNEEILKQAKEEDKPILVSIGYSACHWCHVMEKESFEDEVTAKLMNENFINIKIDREERPDLDHIYMDAVQAMTGSGGWPLNIFLTPDLKPFYGGTYFPPVKMHNRPSWKDVLIGVSDLFKNRKSEAETQAEQLLQHIHQSNNLINKKIFLKEDDENVFKKSQIEVVFKNVMAQADTTWGGFGNAPKFPQTFTINFLLRYGYLKNENAAIEHALLSIDKMIEGGIYDQVGGGFSRYSTDGEWLAPHFEKMLYDNALIISSLCDAYQVSRNASYEKIVKETVTFVERELQIEDGFLSALDADSEGIEGKFYTWSKKEIDDILEEDSWLFCQFYNVTENGNWEHTNILRIVKPLSLFCKEKSLDENDVEGILQSSLQKLFVQRKKRIRPSTDDKILLGWNALMIIALCKSFAAFGDKSYKEKAIKNFNFLWEKFRTNEELAFYHTYKDGVAKYPAFLDDYAYLIQACIQLQQITSNNIYLEKAQKLTQYVIENFSDEESNLFFFTAKNQTDIIVRKKEIYDGATPSPNSVMAANLFYLSVIFDKKEWKQKAINMLTDMSEIIIKYPTSFANWCCVYFDEIIGVNEIAVVGSDHENFRDEILKDFMPNKVMQTSPNKLENYPLLKHTMNATETFIYLCKNYSCKIPVNSVSEFISQFHPKH